MKNRLIYLLNAILSRFMKSLVVFLVAVVFSLPYVWMITSAFKPREEIFRYIFPLSWRTFIPLNPTLHNFESLFSDYGFLRPVINSLTIAIVTVTLSVLVCSMIGFILGRVSFRGKDIIFVLILSTMLIPFEAIIVPLFKVIQNIDLNNTYASLVLPWISDPFMIFFFRQQFREFPQELEDAAFIDGCSHFDSFWRIMLPSIKPAIISLSFIKFILSWDSYIWPLIVIRDPSKQVIPVAIANLFTDQDTIWEVVFAGSFVATIPIIILFLFLQRYYLKGLLTSGIKG